MHLHLPENHLADTSNGKIGVNFAHLKFCVSIACLDHSPYSCYIEVCGVSYAYFLPP